jgi:carbon storage regulator
MLILTRKLNESVVIDGNIVVRVVRIHGELVKLGVEAPAAVEVHRQEVFDAIQQEKQLASASQSHEELTDNSSS